MRVLVVADSNLLSPSYARRLLAGLACEFAFTLGIVPALEEEFPRVLRRELLRRENQRLRRLQADAETLGRIDERVRRAASAWIPAVADVENSPFVRCCTTSEERGRALQFETGPLSGAFAGTRLAARAADEKIVAESFAARAERILTNNMTTISHARVNEFARSVGYNHDLLQPPGVAFSEVFAPERDGRRIALAAFAMSVADAQRDVRAEMESLGRFLHYAEFAVGYPAMLAQDHLQSLGPDEQEALLDEARAKASEPPFQTVREAEARLHRTARERLVQGRY